MGVSAISDADNNMVTQSAFSASDGAVPIIIIVNSNTVAGSYGAKDEVDILVGFSEPVDVSGTPQLTLETDSTDAVVDYTSGNGGNSLKFSYTVGIGETSTDLEYKNIDALTLNGGTIRDAALNNASLTLASPGAAKSLGANKDLVIDGILGVTDYVNVQTLLI